MIAGVHVSNGTLVTIVLVLAIVALVLFILGRRA